MSAVPMLLTGRDIATVLATGALTLVDPTTLTGGRRLAYRAGIVTLTAVAAQDGLDDAPQSQTGRVAAVAGAAAVMGVTMPFWERTDASMHRWLAAHGVPRSRLLTAVVTTAATLALTAADRHSRTTPPTG